MSQPISHDNIKSAIEAYIQGFADEDLDAICALYDDEATIEDPVGTPRHEGKEAIRSFYEMALGAKPRLTRHGEPHIVGPFSATPISAHVTMDGEDITISFISVMSYGENGKITSMTAYWKA